MSTTGIETAAVRDDQREPAPEHPPFSERRNVSGRRASDLGEAAQLTLAQTFLACTSTLQGDAVQTLAHQLSMAVSSLSDTGACVALQGEDGSVRTIASTDDGLAVFTQLQIDHEQGPAWDSYHSNETVVQRGVDQELWPDIAPIARVIGYQTLWAFPLCSNGVPIGVLHLAASNDNAIPEHRIELIRLLTDSAGLGIANRRLHEQAVTLSNQLQVALNSRIVIEQAKGMIAARNNVSVDEAFNLLRAFSRNHHRKLHEVAVEVVSGQVPVRTVAGASSTR